MMDEKRRFERFRIAVPARIEMIDPAGKREQYDLETIDLSAVGACLKSGKPLKKGSRVRIEIFLHFEEPGFPAGPDGSLTIAATGRVLRSEYGEMTIHFNEDYDVKTTHPR